MKAYTTLIANALYCNEERAINVERYINEGNMINWADASAQLINTIARAVNEKLIREVVARPARKTATTSAPSAARKAKAAPKAAKKATKTGTKIAHAMIIYKEMFVDGTQCSRQDVISALTNSMGISRQQAAGYYQTCKKRV